MEKWTTNQIEFALKWDKLNGKEEWVRVSELLSFIDYYDKSGVYPGHILSKLKNELSQSNGGSQVLPECKTSTDKGLEKERIVGDKGPRKPSKPYSCPVCKNIIYDGETIVWDSDNNEVHSGCLNDSKPSNNQGAPYWSDIETPKPVSNKVTNVPVSLCETPKCPKCNCELDDSVFVPGIKVHKWGAKGCKWKDVEEFSLRRSE